MPHLRVHFPGARHRSPDLLAQQFPIPLAQPMDPHLQGTLGQSQFPTELGIADGSVPPFEQRLQAFKNS